MTLKEQRKRVLLREREIKNLIKGGKTIAEVAEQLGVTKQRVQNFLYQAKQRKPILDRIGAIRSILAEDRELAKNKVISVYPGKRKNALDVLSELRELLARSEFDSGSTTASGGDAMLILVNKIGTRPLQKPAVEDVMLKLRTAVLSAYRTTLIRLRQFNRSKDLVGQAWSFAFSKS